MKCFRIKHIPTGWYYCPSRKIKSTKKNERGYSDRVNSNLSEKGKIYSSYPSLDWMGHSIYNHMNNGRLEHTEESDWEIEEI